MVVAVDTGNVYDRTAEVYVPVALAVIVLVFGATLWLTWRGTRRRQPGGPAEAHRFEAAVAAVIALVVAGLIAVSFHEQGRVDAAKAAPGDLRVRVVAAKWNWRFEYPGLGITETARPGVPSVLTVPAGRDVRFTGTSLDVDHAFWIPAMRFQRQLFPGRDVAFTLTFPRPGVTDPAACSMFCGLGHTDMRFVVRVLPGDAFDAWARGARTRG
jgi:heme/copper-type cytochrome/quinol oxidase subunit 2